MYLLITYIIFFIITALTILALPFRRNNHALMSRPFIFISSFIGLTSMTLYLSLGQIDALSSWLSYGKNHYELTVKVQELGGMAGLIARLEERLKEHPDDKKALEMLRKLTPVSQHTD